MQRVHLPSLLNAIANSLFCILLLSVCSRTNAAPVLSSGTNNYGEIGLLQVRLAHDLSGRYVTVDPQTGRIAASSSASNNQTLFTQFFGSSGSFRFMSAALPDHFLSIVARNGSSNFTAINPRNESLGGSGGSGSADSASGSGEVDPSLVTQVYSEWQRVDDLHFYYRQLKINIDGRDCYLAFEADGSPVADPCSVQPQSGAGDLRAFFVVIPR